MFKVILLICAASLEPSDCQPQTAIDVLQGPVAANEITCGLHSQAYLAESALSASLSKDSYLKVVCTRTSIGKSNVG